MRGNTYNHQEKVLGSTFQLNKDNPVEGKFLKLTKGRNIMTYAVLSIIIIYIIKEIS